ncbi:(deoxy)nucleoside triphosphate pyrophosphohydrolase [Saccharomonospora azurea]|uniref:(deoxy)nucleoside triphosphate pyrophosphohydrolase n=1 Tax=Saccharomonospora azurea TaxID=40988 RepID=UPI00023FF385|nr:NUDIX domain-containing protein [Saccharomonospora azurea]EHK87760.1 NUDIX hydrolase [Saccharomonospora azurea SZMC 14600]
MTTDERSAGPATGPSATVVVGAALVRDGRLLVQQRAFPEDVAGLWEIPGGRVEPGETDVEGLRRECREELGVDVVVGDRVGAEVTLPNGMLFRVYAVTLDGAVEPRAVEHRALRWVTASELVELDWLPADQAFLPDLLARISPE